MRISIARLNLRAGTGLSAAFGLALTFASLPAAAQQWTPRPANLELVSRKRTNERMENSNVL
jgi:hypothetical protein